MGSLTALLLATPLFGFSLSAPLVDHTLDLSARSVAYIAAEDSAQEQGDGASADATDSAADSAGDEHKPASADDKAQADYIEQTKRRNDLAAIHRVFGIATWAAMTATVALGFMSYYNLYGIGADQGHNPCVKGGAIGGDSGCDAFRSAHGIAAGITTALYATTFTLSILMPDPDDLSSGKGDFAKTLRLHKTLRWVHLGGMIAQIALGIIMASTIAANRANNYGTLQALATVHMGLGLVTLGALTWAGALMTF